MSSSIPRAGARAPNRISIREVLYLRKRSPELMKKRETLRLAVSRLRLGRAFGLIDDSTTTFMVGESTVSLREAAYLLCMDRSEVGKLVSSGVLSGVQTPTSLSGVQTPTSGHWPDPDREHWVWRVSFRSVREYAALRQADLPEEAR